jgi:hypothetical protein
MLISDCVQVMCEHTGMPGPFGGIAKAGLNVFPFTIPLDGYKRAK